MVLNAPQWRSVYRLREYEGVKNGLIMSKIFDSIKVSKEVKDLVDQRFEFLNSENTEQGTSSSNLVGDTRLLGTGCDTFASGDGSSKELDAAPLGHKIDTERLICVRCGHSSYIRKSVVSGKTYCQQC